MSQIPPGSLGMPFLGEALKFLKDPFAFTLDRTRKHGNIWKTRILGDTVVFFAGPKAFSFFMNPENFTRQNGSPKFLQERRPHHARHRQRSQAAHARYLTAVGRARRTCARSRQRMRVPQIR